jgi:cytochrome c553
VRIAILIAASALVLAIPAQAKMPFVKQAKELGFAEITSCKSCHVDAMPKKGASAPNERGKYLVATKAAKKAAEVDLNWLKDYKGK